MAPSTSKSLDMCSMPNEVVELIASQLTLSFKDVIAFSLTSRRIHEATAFLVTRPLLVEDMNGTAVLHNESNPAFGLSRASVVNVKFVMGDARAQSDQSEQLRSFLARAPRLRYLALRRPPHPIDKQDVPLRWGPSRCKTSTHPFPLRTCHFRTGGSYLSNLTHLDLSDLSIHPMIFSRLLSLTHLKLSLYGHQDAYLPSEVLNIITSAKACKLVAFEIGMDPTTDRRERMDVVRACARTWPSLRTLNLVSADSEGKVLNLDGWMRPENAVDSAVELAEALQLCSSLTNLLLGLSTRDVNTLAIIFQQYFPLLESFGCLAPCIVKSGNRRPFFESFEVISTRRAKQDGWALSKSTTREGYVSVFGMIE
ncbi:hypothetical protein OPQ81_000065 [Rhizoctonia solani]|nr:hypothetical protein OPQ81_000065 [Rhizoctonia solani]